MENIEYDNLVCDFNNTCEESKEIIKLININKGDLDEKKSLIMKYLKLNVIILFKAELISKDVDCLKKTIFKKIQEFINNEKFTNSEKLILTLYKMKMRKLKSYHQDDEEDEV